MPPLPAGGAAFISEETASAVPLMSKTGYLDDTDHPGPSIPAGGVDGLPIGLMLVDERFDEASLYRVAAAYKATGEGRHR